VSSTRFRIRILSRAAASREIDVLSAIYFMVEICDRVNYRGHI
jgi:hypothetical protein